MRFFDALYLNVKVFCSKVLTGETTIRVVNNWPTSSNIRELQQQRRRQQRKRHLKSEVALLQTLSRLFHLVQFIRYWQFFGGSLILKDCIEVQGKKNKVVVLCSRFHVVVVHNDGKEMYKNAWYTCRVVVLPILTHCFFVVLVDFAVVVA